jgi:hypothetical protein
MAWRGTAIGVFSVKDLLWPNPNRPKLLLINAPRDASSQGEQGLYFTPG